MFGYHRDDNAEVGGNMLKTALYVFGAFVVFALILIIAQSL